VVSIGPLAGVRVLELGGIGPNPFAGMLLSDMGADVLRLDRAVGAGVGQAGASDPTLRGRQTLVVDFKSAQGRAAVLKLGANADDINYISLSGALGASQRVGERPMFALNLVGDYGGGAMLLAFGVVCGILEARSSGQGQVVDAAMVDGAALLTTLMHAMHAAGAWNETPGTNLLDSGAHFYEVYVAADGGHVAVGAIEPQFYARLLELLEISPAEMPQFEQTRWPEFKVRLATVFASRTAAEWGELLELEEVCATIVRGPFDAHLHPHMAARESFIELDGVRQPAPAPRFSRTPGAATAARRDPDAALRRWGLSAAQLGLG
jgi:alpha-methylacyl-CoA racemase